MTTGQVSFVNRSTEALFVTEIDDGKGWVVSDVARARALGWVSVRRIERCERSGCMVKGILEDGVRVFDVGDVNESIVRRWQDRVRSCAAFVEEGDPGTRVALFVERINVDMATTVVSAEEKFLISIEGKVSVSVLKSE